MRRRQRYPIHKPVRRWRNPLKRVCACGMAWPCHVKTMLDRHADGLAAAREWQDDERRGWAGGAR